MSPYRKNYSWIVALGISLLFSVTSVHAQRNLTITLIDQYGQSSIGINVELRVAAQRLLYAKSITDTVGIVSFPNLFYTDTVFLRIDDYRYLDAEYILFPGTDTASFSLERLPLELTQITVNAQKSPVTISGDTMYFDADAYRLGNETTLGDLINRIPDLSLNENGDILYQDRPIDHLFVEGKDIYGGLQRNATNGISAADVAGIKLLQRYQGFGDIIGGFSNKVVVDIQLKDSTISQWFGTGELLAGTRSAHDAAANLSRVSSRSGFNGALTASTAPGSQLTTKDYLNTRTNGQGIRNFQRQQNSFTLDDLVPAPLRLAEGMQDTRGLLGRLGYDRRISSRKALRLNVLVNEERHDFARFLTLNSPAIQDGEINTFRVMDKESFNRRLAIGSLELNLGNLTDSTRGRGGLSYDFTYVRGGSQITRTTAGQAIDLPFNHGVTNSTSRLYVYRIAPSAAKVFTQKTEVSWQYDLERSSIESLRENTLPEFLESGRSGEYKAKRHDVELLHTLRYEGHAVSTYLTTGSSISYLLTERRTDQRVTPEAGNQTSRDVAAPFDIGFDYILGKYRLRSILRGRLLHRSIPRRSATQLPYKSLFVFRRGLTSVRFMQLRTAVGREMTANLRQGSMLLAVPRPFTIDRNDASPFLRAHVRTIGADYFNRDIAGTKTFILLTANRDWITDGQQEVFLAREQGWIETTYLPLGRSNNASVTLRTQFPIASRFTIATTAVVMDARQPKSPLAEQPYHLQQSNLGVNFRAQRIGDFEFVLSYQVNRTRQEIALSPDLTSKVSFSIHEWHTTVRYKSSDWLEFTANVSRRCSRVGGVDGTEALITYPATIDVTCRLGKSSLPSLYLRGNNLINYNPQRQQRTVLDNFGVNNTSFVDIPGYIQIGIQKRW